jgi:Tol biopolymer transport system component
MPGEIAYSFLRQLNTEVFTTPCRFPSCTDSRLYALRTAPRRVRRLVPCREEQCYDFDAAWSPDGDRLAFARQFEDGSYQLALTDDSSRMQDLPVSGRYPSWSPGGKRLLFVDVSASGRSELFSVRPDGQGRRQLTFRGGFGGDWSSRGTIAFSRSTTQGLDIFTLSRTAKRATRVTRSGDVISPSWSPDGEWLAFSRYRPTVRQSNRTRPRGLYVRRSTGGRERLLVKGRIDSPAWSPDGRQIAFVWRSAKPYGIYRTDLRGGAPKLLKESRGDIDRLGWRGVSD